MPTYNANEIIGKSLIAKKPVPVKRLAMDSAPTIYTVAPGATVGTVFSWLDPNADRKNLYWIFFDAFNRAYYVEHIEGRFDIKGLEAQGAETTEEKTEREKRENETFGQTLERYAKSILIGGGALIALGLVLKNKPWK